ncbi:MAG: beta-ketoacyl synthase chain length factor [Sulfuricurvum sp.]|nr:beta-ketoacyl synthase chain length factor [Sulfuricurvum sp.]MDD5385567.1 beta-ketoacyl synthase chain length factor [Sulfuricurvum sp.]
MQINLEILGFATVEDSQKCTALNEKRVVSDMMLRRRLTRNARISLYLTDQIGDFTSPVVIGNAYGEVGETFDILRCIAINETVSPTAFQNSVHNTPASYLSIVGENKGYITTVSDLHATSTSVLKVGAVKSLSYDTLLLIVSDSVDFERVSELNRCGITLKECGVALRVRHTTKEPTVILEGKKYAGYSPSIWSMLEIVEKLREAKSGEAIIAIEI